MSAELAQGTVELPKTTMSVPVMIAMLGRIADQLRSDEATAPLAKPTAAIIEDLFQLREQALAAMIEADRDRQQLRCPAPAAPARFC